MIPKRSPSVSASCFPSFVAAVLALFAAGATLAGRAAGAESEARVGIVDTLKMLDVLDSWQDAQSELWEQEAAAEKSLAGKKAEIDRIEAELRYFKPGSRDHDERQTQVSARRRELAAAAERLRADLDERFRAALDAIQRQMRDAVREYAAANGYDLVVDARAVLYAGEGRDIGLKVAREMNKRYKERQEKEKPHPDEGKR